MFCCFWDLGSQTTHMHAHTLTIAAWIYMYLKLYSVSLNSWCECIHKSRYLHRRIQTLPAPQFFLASPRGLRLHTTSLRRNPAPGIPHVIRYLFSVRTLTAPPAAFSTLLLNPWADQKLCEAPKTRRTSYTAKHIIASSYSITSHTSLSPLTKQFKT